MTVTVKNEKSDLSKKAKTARSEARKAAKKDPKLDDGLETEINAIDERAEEQRAKIDSKIYELKLPQGKLVKVKPLPPDDAATPALEAAAQEAKARADEAESTAAVAACDAERAAKKLERLGPCPTINYLMGKDLKGKMSQDERECRDAEFELWAAPSSR